MLRKVDPPQNNIALQLVVDLERCSLVALVSEVRCSNLMRDVIG